MQSTTVNGRLSLLLSVCQDRQFFIIYLLLLTVALSQAGCARYSHEVLVDAGQVASETVSTGEFTHRIFHTFPAGVLDDRSRHFYIGGDGRPWRRPTEIALDPTPRQAVFLQLMVQQAPEAVYLGRPCYFRVVDSRCRAPWWTVNRYHPAVVDSLLATVESLAPAEGVIWLWGYSGGGTLATLVGHRLQRPAVVITYAANLDHQAWTAHHDYTPLSGSLNPMTDDAHNPELREIHWYGRKDRNIVPAWSRAYCDQHGTVCRALEASHTEGWQAQWPRIQKESRRIGGP